MPAVYGSRTSLIDSEGQTIGVSPLFRKPPAFANALVQNIAGGNTMVFNEPARQLLIKAGGAVDVPSHDWWLYLLATAGGGTVHYDTWCSVRYRRHERNLVGLNIGIVPRVHPRPDADAGPLQALDRQERRRRWRTSARTCRRRAARRSTRSARRASKA
jgi:hypothetical protein